MEYSISSANLILTKCFDIKLYLIQAHRFTLRLIVDICDTDLDFRFNIAALPYLYR